MPMTIEQIAEADARKNYPGKGVTAAKMINSLREWKKQGADLERVGDTIFIVENPDDEDIVFHAVTGEDGGKLRTSLIIFCAYMHAMGKKVARAYYENPKVNQVVQGLATVTQTGNQFEAVFDLGKIASKKVTP